MHDSDTAPESRTAEVRILAVDDTPANLVALCALLEPLGHEIVIADCGAKAIACAAESEFALVLLDAVMPDMDGFETLKRLKSSPSFAGTPVLLVTAHDPLPGTLEGAFALGAVDYVPKPIAPEILRAKVEVFVSLYRRGLELRRRSDALAAKDRHIAILAHDLRAPLATITLTADYLSRRDASARDQEQLARILKASHRMEVMTGDLLEFARGGADGLPAKRADMDLAALCREVIDEIGAAHPERPIELEVVGDLWGRWDRERLLQALSNLLVNALKYGSRRTRVQARRLSAQVELTVWNDGEPIPAPRIGRIFEPFERGQQGGTGLGLGLYVVREIARSHRGNVEVSSSPARGTMFTLVLPVESGTAALADKARS